MHLPVKHFFMTIISRSPVQQTHLATNSKPSVPDQTTRSKRQTSGQGTQTPLGDGQPTANQSPVKDMDTADLVRQGLENNDLDAENTSTRDGVVKLLSEFALLCKSRADATNDAIRNASEGAIRNLASKATGILPASRLANNDGITLLYKLANEIEEQWEILISVPECDARIVFGDAKSSRWTGGVNRQGGTAGFAAKIIDYYCDNERNSPPTPPLVGNRSTLTSQSTAYRLSQNNQNTNLHKPYALDGEGYVKHPTRSDPDFEVKASGNGQGKSRVRRGSILEEAPQVDATTFRSSDGNINIFKDALKKSERPLVVFPPSARGDMNAYKYTAFLGKRDRPLTVFEYFPKPKAGSEQETFNRNLDAIKQHLSLPNGKLSEGHDYIFASQADISEIKKSMAEDAEKLPHNDFKGAVRDRKGKLTIEFINWAYGKRARHYQTYDNVMSNRDVRRDVHSVFGDEIKKDSEINAYLGKKLPSVDVAAEHARRESKLIIINVNKRVPQGKWSPREYRHTTPGDADMQSLVDCIYDAQKAIGGRDKLDICFVGSKFTHQEQQNWIKYSQAKNVKVHFFNDMIDEGLNRMQQRVALFELSNRYKSTIYLGHQSGVNEDAQILPRTNVYSLSENLGQGQVGISRVEARPQLDIVTESPIGMAARANNYGNFYSLRNSEFLTTEGVLAAVQIKLSLKGMNHRSLSDLWGDLLAKTENNFSDMKDAEAVDVLFDMILKDAGKELKDIGSVDLDDYKSAIAVIVRRKKADESSLSPKGKQYFINAMKVELLPHDSQDPITRHDDKIEAHNEGVPPYQLGSKEIKNRAGGAAVDDKDSLAWLFPTESKLSTSETEDHLHRFRSQYTIADRTPNSDGFYEIDGKWYVPIAGDHTGGTVLYELGPKDAQGGFSLVKPGEQSSWHAPLVRQNGDDTFSAIFSGLRGGGNEYPGVAEQARMQRRAGASLAVKAEDEWKHVQTQLKGDAWTPDLSTIQPSADGYAMEAIGAGGQRERIQLKLPSNLVGLGERIRETVQAVHRNFEPVNGKLVPRAGVTHHDIVNTQAQLDGLNTMNAGFTFLLAKGGSGSYTPPAELASAIQAQFYAQLAQQVFGGTADIKTLAHAVFTGLKDGGHLSPELVKFVDGAGKVIRLDKILKGGGALLSAASLGLNVYLLANAKTEEEKAIYGTNVATDGLSVSLALVDAGAQIAPKFAGGALAGVAEFAGPLGVPISGLSYGATALVKAFFDVAHRALKVGEDITKEVQAYRTGYVQDADSHRWHPSGPTIVTELNLRNNQVSFGSPRIYAVDNSHSGDPRPIHDEQQSVDLGETLKLPHTQTLPDTSQANGVLLPGTPGHSYVPEYNWLPGSTSRHDAELQTLKEIARKSHGKFIESEWVAVFQKIVDKLEPVYHDATVTVKLGPNSAPLIVDELDERGQYLTYDIEGQGGQYTIELNEGPRVKLSTGSKSAASTWVLRTDNLDSEEITFSDDQFTVGGVSVQVSGSDRVLVINRRGEQYDVDMETGRAPITALTAGEYEDMATLQARLQQLRETGKLSVGGYVRVENMSVQDYPGRSVFYKAADYSFVAIPTDGEDHGNEPFEIRVVPEKGRIEQGPTRRRVRDAQFKVALFKTYLDSQRRTHAEPKAFWAATPVEGAPGNEKYYGDYLRAQYNLALERSRLHGGSLSARADAAAAALLTPQEKDMPNVPAHRLTINGYGANDILVIGNHQNGPLALFIPGDEPTLREFSDEGGLYKYIRTLAQDINSRKKLAAHFAPSDRRSDHSIIFGHRGVDEALERMADGCKGWEVKLDKHRVDGDIFSSLAHNLRKSEGGY